MSAFSSPRALRVRRAAVAHTVQRVLEGMGHLNSTVLVDANYSRKLCGRDLQRAVLRAVAFTANTDPAEQRKSSSAGCCVATVDSDPSSPIRWSPRSR